MVNLQGDLSPPPRLVVVATAQLKRDHPELALTATDEVTGMEI